MLLTDKLLGFLNRVFSKDPDQFLAFRIDYDGGMSWKVFEGRLYTNVSGGSGTDLNIDLSAYTLSTLAAYIATQDGYSVSSNVTDSRAIRTAQILIDGTNSPAASNGNCLYAYSSLTWSYMHANAMQLVKAKTDIVEMLKQMSLQSAESEWLDDLGDYYGVRRLAGEPDTIYVDRILLTIVRPKGNNIALAMAIETLTKKTGAIVVDAPMTTITTWWRADGTMTAIGDRQACSTQRSHYGQFDVACGFDLMSGEPISDMMDRVRAVVEKFRDAGTRMRQLSISGGIEDSSSQPDDENTFSLSVSEMVDARPPIRLLADGTTLVGPVTRIRCDGSIQANGSTSAAGYAITEGAAQAGAVVDPMDVAARIDFLDSAICAVFADGAARANGLITASGDRATALDDAGVTIRIARRLDGRHRVADGMPLATGAWFADGAAQCGVGSITASAISETFEHLQS